MAKKIKNYTSSIPVERTISYIESELVKIGVTHIEKNYKNSVPVGIIFSIELPTRVSFKIPADADAAYDVIKDIPEYRSKKDDWLHAQAKRTAWKIVFNWVEVQVAMVQLKQADAMQIFLPYVYDKKSGKTFYDKISKNGFKLLTSQ